MEKRCSTLDNELKILLPDRYAKITDKSDLNNMNENPVNLTNKFVCDVKGANNCVFIILIYMNIIIFFLYYFICINFISSCASEYTYLYFAYTHNFCI